MASALWISAIWSESHSIMFDVCSKWHTVIYYVCVSMCTRKRQRQGLWLLWQCCLLFLAFQTVLAYLWCMLEVSAMLGEILCCSTSRHGGYYSSTQDSKVVFLKYVADPSQVIYTKGRHHDLLKVLAAHSHSQLIGNQCLGTALGDASRRTR